MSEELVGQFEAYKMGVEDTKKQLNSLVEQNRVFREALMRIADPTSALEYPVRSAPYSDWELRRIAREALENS